MMIRKLRRRAGLTQAELAEVLGVHRVAVIDLEKGRRHLRLVEFARVASALKLPDDQIAALVRSAIDDDDQRRAA